MAESSIEISTPPAWLSKLESRREILSKARIGHEAGAGAPCNVCGDKCPGLDLHFWRKLCRNCKCRKDQHDIPIEDSFGWAQFELLGAIRSKPAYLNIEALENQAVHLDWVPPNITPDLAMDYMNQLGTDQIPITGSIAATHRKQQLEYQVPPHDLNPDLCHDLSNNEKTLFEKHIAKIIKNSGQGYVSRLGLNYAISGVVDLAHGECVPGKRYSAFDSKNDEMYIKQTSNNNPNLNINQIFNNINEPILESIKKDKILINVLHSDLIKGLRHDPLSVKGDKLQLSDHLGNNQISLMEDFMNSCLSKVAKEILIPMKINSQTIQSAVLHGWCYDKILKDLDNFNIDYSDDLLLQPIKHFLAEFAQNPSFQSEMKNYAIHLGGDILTPSIMDDNVSHNDKNVNMKQPKGIKSIDEDSSNNEKHDDDVHPIINYSTFPYSNEATSAVENAALPLGKLQRFPDNHIANIMEKFKCPDVIQATNPIPQHDNYLPNYTTKPKAILQGIGDLHISSQESDNVKCWQCNSIISSGEVTVTIERNGSNTVWHPKCFICHTCHELLADLVYFHHKDNIYCARDFATILNIPRCKACDELIFTHEYTAAEGANFHIRHFCCFNCDTPLADQSYVSDSKTSQPICLPCYENYQAEKCNTCHKPIAASEQGVAWGEIHWHSVCFNCAGKSCGKSLLGGRFMVKNNLPLCSAECFRSLNA